MATYPTLMTLRETVMDVDAGITAARAHNGMLRQRVLYPASKRDWALVHCLTTAEKDALVQFYRDNKLLDVVFNWVAEGTTHNVRFASAPQPMEMAGWWHVSVRIREAEAYVAPPVPYIGFHAPLSADDQDIITPIADALSNGSPVYIGGWCRLSGDTQQIRWRPVGEAAANGKLSASAYSGKITYKCRVRKGTTPSTTGSTTFRFFSVYNSFGYSGFFIGNSGQVGYTDYRLFPDAPLTNTYEGFVASGSDSVYEMRYEAGSGFMTFYVDNALVYTSLFANRLVGNGITIRTPDPKYDYLEFKDCQLIVN